MAKIELSWNLDDIITIQQFDEYVALVKKDIQQFDRWWLKLNPTMPEEEFKEYVSFALEAGDRLSRVSSRPHLTESVNEKDKTAQTQKSIVKDLSLQFSEVTTKIDLWFKGIKVQDKKILDDANAKRLFATVAELEYSLHYGRLSARHSLEEREENIITAKDLNGAAALVDLRDQIATEQTYVLELPGKKPQIIENEEELKISFYSSDKNVRAAAYQALLGSYQKNADKYFTIYQAIVKNWDHESKLRGYDSPIAMRNFANHVPDKAIETLLEVCSHNTSIFQDFFKFKAKSLGLEQLRRFDIYAPLEQDTKKISVEEAIDVVTTTFTSFSKQFGDYSKQVIEAKHIDYPPRPNKRGGAFATTITSSITPYVLLNYTNSLRDVSTLAHELGHAVHFLYAQNLPSSVQMSGLPLAETASTLGEMILFEKLLAKTTNSNERKAMLMEKMGDSYATICRQSFFIKAEIKAHKRMSEGMTSAEMGELWLNNLKEQFGNSVEIDPIFAYEWAYIPHIVHSPFYCYAYNFGELLSLALFARYKHEGKSFVPKIETILASGGAYNPQQVLKKVGIDITDAAFWQGSFEIVKGWMRQLQSL